MIVRRPIEEQSTGRELGIIRIGEKVAGTSRDGRAYTRPAMRETFRITSPFKAVLEAVNAVYPGELRPWAERSAHWELLTETNEMKCVVKPNTCINQWYERWSGGGCTHRCDGEIVRMHDRDGNPMEQSCICDLENPTCSMMTRLSVMISNVPVLGIWRLNSKGKIFASEAWAEVERMNALGIGDQFVYCLLQVRQQEIKKAGKTSKFAIPGITLDPLPPDFPTMLRGLTIGGQMEMQARAQLAAPSETVRQIEAPKVQQLARPSSTDADEQSDVLDATYRDETTGPKLPESPVDHIDPNTIAAAGPNETPCAKCSYVCAVVRFPDGKSAAYDAEGNRHIKGGQCTRPALTWDQWYQTIMRPNN